jgi:hypothetical protein
VTLSVWHLKKKQIFKVLLSKKIMKRSCKNYFHWNLQYFSLNFVMIFLLGCHGWDHNYGSWIFNYLYNQCLSPLKLWVRILFMARCTWCDKVTGQWFSAGTLVSSTNIKLTDTIYNWNIVESGVKHNKSKPKPNNLFIRMR